MKGYKRIIVTAVMAAAVLAAGPAASADDDKDAGGSELIARQKFIKAQFQKLTSKMLEVARLVEKSEPETAKVLQDAVDQSRRAFIAEDMDKVAEYLSKGLATAAASTKQAVIKELQNILETLRHGVMDIDKRLQRIKDWDKILEGLRKTIEKQEELERRSSIVSRADKIDKQMKKLSAALAGVIAKQKKLLADTRKLAAGNPDVRRLVGLRDKVSKLIAEQEKLNAVTRGAPVDKLPLAGKAQKGLAGKTAKVKAELDAAARDPDLARAMSRAGSSSKAVSAAAKKVSQAAGEMSKASKALGKSDAKAAQGSQKQAKIDLKAAEKQLNDAIKKCSQGTPSGKLGKQQGDLAGQTRELSKAVKEAADGAGMDSKAASMAKAGQHMGKAAKRLSSQDPKAAAKEQKAALKELEDRKHKLAELHRRMLEKAREPLDRQKKEQSDLAARTSKLGDHMKQSPSGAAPGQPSVASASKSMAKASQQLGRKDAISANRSQNDALDDLRKAAGELAKAVDQEREMAQAEQLARIDAMLRRILKTQKAISAGTMDVFKKRRGQRYDRPEQLRLRELSDGEGRLAEDVGAVRKMLLKEGTTAVFPAVLAEVRSDLADVQKRLADKEAGKLTQGIQAQIERNLEQMLAALRKERSRRKKQAGMGEGRGGRGGGGKKQPLVPPAAELKMLKSLQLQINNRTAMLAQEKARAGVTSESLARQHKILSDRQKKLKTITTELAKKLKPAPKGKKGGQ